MDQADAQRRAYLAAVFAKMRDPDARDRIMKGVRDLLVRKRASGLISGRHAGRWEDLLALDLDELEGRMLADTPEAAELRHAHLFAGSLPAGERNRIRAKARLSADDIHRA